MCKRNKCNKKAENCWDYWNCPKEARESCPPYLIDFGKACWMFVSGMRPRVKRDFQHCWECPWFKESGSEA